MTIYRKGPLELRLGRWQDVLSDVRPDSVITDPPYSERTDRGVRSGSSTHAARVEIRMGYAPVDEESVRDFVVSWAPRNRGWWFVCGDHISHRWWEAAFASAGLYGFAPVILVKRGAAPRMCADGPASQCEHVATARPSRADFVGTWPGMPGWYEMQTVRHGHGHHGVRGAKSIDTMRAIVRDYSRIGDLICDPCAGSATTLIAAALEGRNAIGAEVDPKTFRLACNRIEATALTPPLPFGDLRMKQTTIEERIKSR